MEPEQIDRLQARIRVLVDAGRAQKAVDDLAQWNRQFGYQPWIWAMLGRLLQQRGERHAAGRALFWANVRGGDAEPLVEEFTARIRGRPERLVGSLPARCLQPLDAWPEPLRSELQALGVTDRLLARTRRRVTRSEWAFLPLLLFLLAALTIGAFLILTAVWRWPVSTGG